MKFVASKTAFVDNRLIESGTEFEYDYRPGDWAIPSDEYNPAAVVEPEDDTPQTYHEEQTRRGRPPGSKNKPK